MGFAFFTSYARLDGDRALRRFVNDLREEVRSKTGRPPDEIAFFDTTNIETGDDWMAVLSQALRTSQLCVCLCSPTYFNSRFCGKEFYVFTERRRDWLHLPANAGKRARVLFPVLWELSAGQTPAALAPIQDSDDSLPRSYREMGLRTLAKLKGQRDNYNRVVMALALRMRDALGETQLAEWPQLPPFALVPSAFHDDTAVTGDAARYNVSVVFWNKEGAAWTPYAGGESVGMMAESAASGLKLASTEIRIGQDCLSRLQEAHKARQAVLIVTDAATMQSGDQAPLVDAFDRSELTNAALLIVWTDANANRNEAEQTVRTLLPRRSGSAAARFDETTSITSEKDLRAKMETAITRVRSALIASDEPIHKAESPSIEQEAQREGIPLASAPGLTGPGGGAR